ncbi:MAG: CPBP family glutamic-type intramembrane protease [Chitinophagaceae bacterium]
MKTIIGYVRDYFKKDCNYRYLLALCFFLGAAIFINFFVVSEDVWIKADPSSLHRLLKYLLGYFVMFGGAYSLLLFFDKDPKLRSGYLWLLVAIGVVLFSIRAWYRPESLMNSGLFPAQYYTLFYKLAVNAAGFVFLFIPVFVFWLFVERKQQRLYGLHARGVVLWPYFVLILLMLPLLFAAGTQADFKEMYPRAAHLYLSPTDPHRIGGTLAYEFLYSLDYVVTEFFFRGFLILAFARIIGPKAILPMCAFYVSIHFDKPLGECISSFLGGGLLGILAYRSKSIYGGVIVHLGIALGMELVGILN